ncbi:MAG TPA: glycosyltransferase [Gemmatimonadaceae bacterium]|nr:glycosyltransferase [Gemmatimonadaceae bacterium]
MRVVAHNGARIWGGAERATVLLLRGLADRGHDVMLLCNSTLVAERAIAHGVPAQICVIGGDIAVHHAYRLSRVLRKLEPDVFIVGTFKKLFLAALGARLARVPRIIARVGLETDTPRSWKYRKALRSWVDGVVVNAQRMAKSFTTLAGFDPDKVRIIWNGVRSPQLKRDPGSVRRELGLAEDTFVIGSVGRLAKQKRIDRLIDVMALLPGAQCIVAGDGTRRKALEEHMYKKGVADRIHFLGERDDTADVIDALDVFVVTSDTEGLSNAMLEAMARRRPVVSTPVSGADDALSGDEQDPPAGVVAGFSPDAIASVIAELRDDPRRRDELAAAAQLRAETRFSIDRMLDGWEEFLERRTRIK